MSEVGDNSQSVSAKELRAICERVEQVDKEIDELKSDRKEILAEAKGKGYDMRTVREMLRLRKLDPDERSEREALRDLYASALGVFG